MIKSNDQEFTYYLHAIELIKKNKHKELKKIVTNRLPIEIKYGNVKYSLLSYTAAFGKLSIVKWLIKQGANPNFLRNEPFRWACDWNRTDIIKELFKYNINLNTNYIRYWVDGRDCMLLIRELDKGKYWNCYECIVKVTCKEFCDNYKKRKRRNLKCQNHLKE